MRKISSGKKQKLEEIVNRCKRPDVIAKFYRFFGDSEKADFMEAKAQVENYKNSPYNQMMKKLENAKKLKFSDKEIKEIAQQAYDESIKEGLVNNALYIAENFLNLHKEETTKLKKKALYGEILRFSPYKMDDFIPRYAISFSNSKKSINREQIYTYGLPKKEVKKVAKEVYDFLMNKEPLFDARNFFIAGLLAKAGGLGKERIDDAGKKLVESYLSRHSINEYHILRAEAKFLDLSSETIRPAVIAFFKSLVGSDLGEVIERENNLKKEEIEPIVVKEYKRDIECGLFDIALTLREKYSFIYDSNISLGDLKTLAKIERS